MSNRLYNELDNPSGCIGCMGRILIFLAFLCVSKWLIVFLIS